MIRALIIFVQLSFTSFALADNWIDEDGEGVLRIDERSVSFFSIGDNYYFDQIFTKVRKNQSKVTLCFGFRTTEGGKPKSCLRNLKATPATQNEGKVRALHVNTEEELFFTILVQGQLRQGATVVVSIDDNDLYLSYQVNGTNKLTDEAQAIMRVKKKDLPKLDKELEV